jgi:hypothetical protein
VPISFFLSGPSGHGRGTERQNAFFLHDEFES